jgi:hypothetical protein
MTTYKTRVAPKKPCKERLGIAIGQLMDSRRVTSRSRQPLHVLLG